MIMSFANPLGVGLTSDGEYFDIELTEPITSKEAVRKLNEVMVEGMEVVSFVQIPENKKTTGMAIIEAADYLALPKEGTQDVTEAAIEDFLSQEEILVLKQTKKSEKEVNIRPWILEMKKQDTSIFLKVCAGSSTNLKPELVISAFLKQIGSNLDAEADYRYHRLENYARKDEALVPLDALGTEIV